MSLSQHTDRLFSIHYLQRHEMIHRNPIKCHLFCLTQSCYTVLLIYPRIFRRRERVGKTVAAESSTTTLLEPLPLSSEDIRALLSSAAAGVSEAGFGTKCIVCPPQCPATSLILGLECYPPRWFLFRQANVPYVNKTLLR